MGLDMYLTARKELYVGRHIDDSNGTVKIELPEELKMFENNWEEVMYLTTDYRIGYWRKANHIHNWFVENCGNGIDECQDMYVDKKKLQELLKVCDDVLAEHGDASNKLPTCDGCLFGSTDYDEYYFDETKRTKEICERAIQFLEEREKAKDYVWEIHYRASW